MLYLQRRWAKVQCMEDQLENTCNSVSSGHHIRSSHQIISCRIVTHDTIILTPSHLTSITSHPHHISPPSHRNTSPPPHHINVTFSHAPLQVDSPSFCTIVLVWIRLSTVEYELPLLHIARSSPLMDMPDLVLTVI
ncbi:uncharacterized protein YALI1_D29074g [Yarrowia lipolytica]|uniref:Uncharacterized protein n=1 Tax=Yarrowia lipolytica TaxID=4952 RepID=A0A1D8NFR2_YARLL|nr:hypothetical protein YALI1_D29074g [Yarrowia lipolytica]